MAEINGYLLTEEEAKACEDLIKKMRERKEFEINFVGRITVKANSPMEAYEIFGNWASDIQDNSLIEWNGTLTRTPYFEERGIHQEIQKEKHND